MVPEVAEAAEMVSKSLPLQSSSIHYDLVALWWPFSLLVGSRFPPRKQPTQNGVP